VENKERLAALARILGHYRPESTLVFCNTRKDCQEVADALTDRNFSALAIHGDLEQRERDQVLARFANKSVSILVATDVAARGIDIKELTAVVNYELTRDPEVHIHRIGRTGRAGEQGLALSLVTAAENRRAAAIEDYLGETVPRAELETLAMPTAAALEAPMVTLCIDGGRKNKLRPGDLLGALTGDAEGENLDIVGKAGETSQFFADLVGKFASWTQHQPLHSETGHVQPRQEADAKGGSFATAGLCLSNYIGSRKNQRQAVGLNWRHLAIAERVKALEHRFLYRQSGKCSRGHELFSYRGLPGNDNSGKIKKPPCACSLSEHVEGGFLEDSGSLCHSQWKCKDHVHWAETGFKSNASGTDDGGRHCW
jgi:hypothetical protein